MAKYTARQMAKMFNSTVGCIWSIIIKNKDKVKPEEITKKIVGGKGNASYVQNFYNEKVLEIVKEHMSNRKKKKAKKQDEKNSVELSSTIEPSSTIRRICILETRLIEHEDRISELEKFTLKLKEATKQ
jgi:hypothetical protein